MKFLTDLRESLKIKRILQRTSISLQSGLPTFRVAPPGNSFRFRDSYAYPLSLTFFSTFPASVCFFLVLPLLFVSTDRSYKRVSPLRRAFGVFCSETCYQVSIPFANLEAGFRSLRRAERALSLSQPIPNIIVLASKSLEAHREEAISRWPFARLIFQHEIHRRCARSFIESSSKQCYL